MSTEYWIEMSECKKYYDKHMDTIIEYAHCLYNLDGCVCGGLGHAVLDDNNFEDVHLKSTLEDCDKPENQDREEKDILRLICADLLKLSHEQRVLLYKTMNEDVILCNGDCDNCKEMTSLDY